jgi:hypothetical protein
MSLLDKWKELKQEKRAAIWAARWADKENEWEETILDKMREIVADPAHEGYTHRMTIKTETEEDADHLESWCKETHNLYAIARERSKRAWDVEFYPYEVEITWDDD